MTMIPTDEFTNKVVNSEELLLLPLKSAQKKPRKEPKSREKSGKPGWKLLERSCCSCNSMRCGVKQMRSVLKLINHILIKGGLVGDRRYLACLGYMGWGALLEGLPVAPFNVYQIWNGTMFHCFN